MSTTFDLSNYLTIIETKGKELYNPNFKALKNKRMAVVKGLKR